MEFFQDFQMSEQVFPRQAFLESEFGSEFLEFCRYFFGGSSIFPFSTTFFEVWLAFSCAAKTFLIPGIFLEKFCRNCPIFQRKFWKSGPSVLGSASFISISGGILRNLAIIFIFLKFRKRFFYLRGYLLESGYICPTPTRTPREF